MLSHQKVDLHNNYLVLWNDITSIKGGRKNLLKLTFCQAFDENEIEKQIYSKNMEMRKMKR